MSEKGTESGLGGYLAVAFVTGIAVYSFTRPSTPTTISAAAATSYPTDYASGRTSGLPTPAGLPQSTPTLPAVPSGPVTPPLPVHRYVAREGTTYYYSAAVSEEEYKRTGRSAPDALAFWYIGKNSSNDDIVAQVINGQPNAGSYCARPCKIIHYGDGTALEFHSGSVIGAVYSDVAKGFLKRHEFPKPPPAVTQSDAPFPSQESTPSSN